MRKRRPLYPLLFAILMFLALSDGGFKAQPAQAHAELVSADPPINGVVFESPANIRLHFSEPVATDPAPTITLLDESGSPVGPSPLAVTPSSDARDVLVNAPNLGQGTYTVSWAVTSSTDGHPLSGSYAFRVGVGIPPGSATSTDAAPAAWAIATRWITFLAAAFAAGVLAFQALFASTNETRSASTRQPQTSVIASAIVGLVASGLEPVISSRTSEPARSIGDALTAMPNGWWWRPAGFIALLAYALTVTYAFRGRLTRGMARGGAVIALIPLLGLALTSHAAGREHWHAFAVTIDLVHQVSVALWVGLLVALALAWWHDRTIALPTFSRIALWLVAIAVVTGLLNAGLVYPLVQQVRANGLSANTLRPVWDALYGKYLIAKVLVLLIPLGLAARHRSLVRRALPSRFPTTLRAELALAAVVVLGGSTLALTAPPVKSTESSLSSITVVAATSDDIAAVSTLVHLTIDPADTGENTFRAWLTDAAGKPIADANQATIVLDLTNLDFGETLSTVNLQPTADSPPQWLSDRIAIGLKGWWQVTATITRGGHNETATWFLLLPDPNTQGFGNAPSQPGDDDAARLLTEAIDQMTGWKQVHLREDIGSGQDALVRAETDVVTDTGNGTPGQMLYLAYVAGFGTRADGSASPPPTIGGQRSISIGENGWLQVKPGGSWLEQPGANFSPPSEWANTYSGADQVHLGMKQEVDDRILQIVTFHLPPKPGRSEAWMAAWIDTATGNVARITMVAGMHYMTWTYTNVNGKIEVKPPV